MTQIKQINAREILDSRGQPTVEVDVLLANGVMGRASVPSGASTGQREALELRDGDAHRYGGKGVQTAIKHIQSIIAPVLIGQTVDDQASIDQRMIDLDGTDNKSRLGANAMLGCSLACARAACHNAKQPLFAQIATGELSLPAPMMNIVNGGAHANNNLDIQEFMVMPLRADTFKEALRMGCEVFQSLKTLLHKAGLATTVGDEGGFAPNFQSHEHALDMIMQAIELAGYQPGHDIYLALDVASSELMKEGQYQLMSTQQAYDAQGFVAYLSELASRYPIISIEDGMSENDWAGWASLSRSLNDKMQLVGDDIFVTNRAYLQKGIDNNIANAILIKLNQIGTLTETLDTIKLAHGAAYATVISHRSGETADTFIADLAVATNAKQIKTGSLSRSDRVAKYNQLLRIEESLAKRGQYAGMASFPRLS